MRILRASCGWSPSVRTLQRHFERLELTTRPDGRPPAAFGRFEASRPNELWTGDALHGPRIAGRKAYLFAFLDDHSRAVMAARWGYFEDTVRLAAALRPALAARGVPDAIYVDNGSAFVDAALKRAAARLGIKITHSQPGRPQGRGKIERFFGVVRQEFLVEIGDGAGIADLAQLNKLFTAWYETVYHARPHGETGQPPIERWLAGAPFPAPSPAQLREAFLWAEWRVVAKTATIKLFGGVYETDPVLAAGASSASSTRSTWPSSRSAGTAGPTAWQSRSTSAGTPIPRRNRRLPPRRRPGPASTTWASSPPSTTQPPGGTASATTPWPATTTRTSRQAGRRAGDRAACGCPARPDQPDPRLVRQADRGRLPAGTAEVAACLTAKASMLERIAAERAAGGWASRDIQAAREAAASARATADAAAAAAGSITTGKDQS